MDENNNELGNQQSNQWINIRNLGVIFLCVICFIGGFTISDIQHRPIINELRNERDEYKRQYEELSDNYTTLLDDYNELNQSITQHYVPIEDHTTLLDDYNELNQSIIQHYVPIKDYLNLVNNHTKLLI